MVQVVKYDIYFYFWALKNWTLKRVMQIYILGVYQ